MQRCPHCGHEVPQQARFCGKCGQSLFAKADPPETSIVLFAGKDDVESKRVLIAEMLLRLVPYASEEERAKNTDLFMNIIATQPPITDFIWGRPSFIAGIYQKSMGETPDTPEDKLALWQVLTWAVQYEHYFRPQQFAYRFQRIVEVYSRSFEDSAFMALARRGVEALFASLNEKCVQDVKRVLARLIPTAATLELEQLIGAQEEKLRTDVPSSENKTEPERDKVDPPMPGVPDDEMPGKNGQAQKKEHLPKPPTPDKKVSVAGAAGFLDMLPEGQRNALLEALRNYQIEQAGVILKQAQQLLLERLSYLLAHPSFKQSTHQAAHDKWSALWERRWNQAVTLMNSESVFQALEVLKPGVETGKAPYPFLRFALTCALDLLESGGGTTTRGVGRSFLLNHLTKLPLVECYLAWLLLAKEIPDVDYHRQLDVVGELEELLNRPIKIILPMNEAGEITIEDFEKDRLDLMALVQRLEEHYTLEAKQETVGIKSKMFSTSIVVPHRSPARVGLFVDVENLWRILPDVLPDELLAQPEVIVEALNGHAQQYGEVVCRWLSVSPVNVSELQQSIDAFQATGFKVQYPHGNTVILKHIENLADFVLLECISFEAHNSKPDIYVIASGDSDYYEKIMSLLEQGHTVRLIASSKNLSSRYWRLQQKSREKQLEVTGRFYVDSLESLLRARKLLPALEKR